jgi:hypothetical protein
VVRGDPPRPHARSDRGQTEGIDDLLDAYPDVRFLVDSGYRGLAKDPAIRSSPHH